MWYRVGRIDHTRSTWLQFLLTSETTRKIGKSAREKAKPEMIGLVAV
jgi:hypothetical protein